MRTFETVDPVEANPVEANPVETAPATLARRSRSANRELIEDIIAQVGATLRHLRCTKSIRLLREGVSMIHLHVLWQLEEHGELAMSGMADLLGMSVSNLTGLVDRMEERGLVERVRLTDDRRVVHIRPTARGLELARTIDILRGDIMEGVFARLDDEQLERLARSVADIRAALFAEPPIVTAEDCGPFPIDPRPLHAPIEETAH